MIKNILMVPLLLFMMAGSAFASISTISPKGHEAIKAKILNNNPSNFTINVRYLRNMGVNEEAPTFALYTSGSLPDLCGDFSSLSISYSKPKKYQRRFNLSNHLDLLDAINEYKCVIIKNIPSK